MRDDIKKLVEELEAARAKINNESRFSIDDNVKIIDSFNKNDIGKTGKIKSRKDFYGGRIIQFADGTMKHFDEQELIKL